MALIAAGVTVTGDNGKIEAGGLADEIATPVKIGATTSASGSSTDLTGSFSSTYHSYLLVGKQLTSDGDNYRLYLQLIDDVTVNAESEYTSVIIKTSSADTSISATNYGTTDSKWTTWSLLDGIGNGSDEFLNVTVTVTAPYLEERTTIYVHSSHPDDTATPHSRAQIGQGMHWEASRFDGIRILPMANDWTGGTWDVYGLKVGMAT